MDKKSYRLAKVLGLAALLLSTALAGAQGSEYGKVRVPVMPGIQALYRKVTLNLVKPHLKDAEGDWLFAADLASESLSGASNYASALGNGRLFVEISPWAELTVFRWPNPTYSDHLRYFTLENGITLGKAKAVRITDDERSKDWKRYGRPVEPCTGLGSSAGVLGADGEVMWSHDPVWVSSRSFIPDDSTILTTTLSGGGVEIKVSDFVHPRMDLLVRDYVVKGAAKFFYHSTFAPMPVTSEHSTLSDPKQAGYAAMYLEHADAVLHVKPTDERSRAEADLESLMRSAAEIDRAYPGGGVYVAWGLSRASDGRQVGADQCNTKQKRGPACAVDDSRDGNLEGNETWAGKVDAALSVDLDSAKESRVTIMICVAGTAAGAVELLEKARDKGADQLRSESRDYWRAVSARVRLPDDLGPDARRVSMRSVLNLIQGQGRDGGEIVASVSRQPHYHFDWPRDGAFFDLVLDMSGFPDRVDRHHGFYKRTQMTGDLAWSPVRMFNFQAPFYKPAGHWPSNMAADGSYGSIPKLLPFEIDETALLVWDMWRHGRVIDENKRADYRGRMGPVLAAAADGLLDYVDMKKGWTKPAVEDDNFPPDATLHGVAAVLTGLASACAAAPEWGFSSQRQNNWCEAARVLREGARARITRPEVLADSGWRGHAWSLWPAPMFDHYGEPGAEALKNELAAKIKDKINLDTPGFAYLGEEIFTLALADQKSLKYRDLLTKALEFLTTKVPFPGTDCYGEVTVWVDVNSQTVSQQRTSIPHIWNGVTVYLAAMAVHSPEAFKGMAPPPRPVE